MNFRHLLGCDTIALKITKYSRCPAKIYAACSYETFGKLGIIGEHLKNAFNSHA